jgi:hypothetical protein
MDCVCGCGTRVSKKTVEANLVAGRVALDLLAWDKERADGQLGADAVELESLIARGANAYQRLLSMIHGGQASISDEEGEDWLEESFDLRVNRKRMTERGGILAKSKLRLTDDDYAVLDRRRPELSFSGDIAGSGARDATDADVAGQLERLGRLRAEGLLTEDEFNAAKARVLSLS